MVQYNRAIWLLWYVKILSIAPKPQNGAIFLNNDGEERIFSFGLKDGDAVVVIYVIIVFSGMCYNAVNVPSFLRATKPVSDGIS